MRFIKVASVTSLLVREAFTHPASSPSSDSLQKRVLNLDAYRLVTTAVYTNSTTIAGSAASNALFKRSNYIDTATALVKKLAPGLEFRVVDDHYVGTNGIAHVNLKQTLHGLDIDNADFNVNVSYGLSNETSTNSVLDCKGWQYLLSWKLLLYWANTTR